MSAFAVQNVGIDLPRLAVQFGARLEQAGLPVGVDRCAAFARALSLVRPISRGRLYWTARAAFVTDRAQVPAFDRAFAAVFGSRPAGDGASDQVAGPAQPAPADEREPQEREPGAGGRHSGAGASASSVAPRHDERDERPDDERQAPTLASDAELLRGRRFESLSAAELAEVYRLISRLRVAAPARRSRRMRRDRHGAHVDLRRTLRASMRNGGDPVVMARRRRRSTPRRIVMLCDISGSMEPYARAYLQFLTCAAGSSLRSGGPVEAFAFATRLTRLTRALQSRSPERAIQRAAAAAPDWSGGTRIGEALRLFNDRHGRRGMARGAVVVILSDGWERSDPWLVGREMQRLARLAHRIIWVNPRAAARDFQPRSAGMLAALPHIDALLSGESLAALDAVVTAIGCVRADPAGRALWQAAAPARGEAAAAGSAEPWGSATPVRGSSVAMPTGWAPSRGNTEPGWGGA